MSGVHPSLALQRVVGEAGVAELVEVLAERLSGADLTTLLLEVMRQRAAAVSPAGLLRRYESDRFVGPATVDARRLRRAEDLLLSSLPSAFELVLLAPLVPLGTHSVVATVDQNKVVSTVRGTEVAADPTNGLALEAAVRRRNALRTNRRSTERYRPAAVQRVVRAQRFEEAGLSAHFTILGLVTAGRDEGDRRFEIDAAVEHARFLTEALRAVGAERVRLWLSGFAAGELGPVLDRVGAALDPFAYAEALADPDRRAGRGYYQGLALRAEAIVGDSTVDVANGGFVTWTQCLLSSKKERLLITGIGVDRLAAIGADL